MKEIQTKVNDKKQENKIVVNGITDIFTCSILLMAIVTGFLGGIVIGKIIFWILVSIEVFLLGVNWVTILLCSTKLKVEYAISVMTKVGTLRTSNNLISLIFKIPIVIGLTYLSKFTGALFIISTLFFEEHRILLIENAIIKYARNIKK